MQRFLVVSHARSGSNLLVRSLNAHPDIACFGELLKPQQGLAELERLQVTPQELEELQRLRAEDTAGFAHAFFDAAERAGYDAAGFKLFYYHAREDGRASIWDAIARQRQWRFVHLYRDDVFGTYLSRELALATNDWLKVAGKSDDPDYDATITVDVAAFRKFRRTLTASIEDARALLPGDKTLVTTYEDFTGDFESGLSEVQRFLHVEPRNIRPPLDKQARKSWREYVTNVDEVEQALVT